MHHVIPIDGCFMPPHKLVRYHAQEYRGRLHLPRSDLEPFNYKHLSLCIVIELSFEVLKVWFPILYHMAN